MSFQLNTKVQVAFILKLAQKEEFNSTIFKRKDITLVCGFIAQSNLCDPLFRYLAQGAAEGEMPCFFP